MREIKFRVWNKKQKFMDAVDGYDLFIADGELYEVTVQGSWDGYMDKENVTNEYALLQYTGLKDKNGKEIYEGDILQYHGEHGPQKGYHKRVVKWNSARGCFFFEKFGVYKGEQNQTVKGNYKLKHEIIGNIYENPELIEKHED